MANTAVAPISPRRPARMASAQPNIDTAKPATPISISRLRPRTSDCRAQNGADTVHSKADSEKITATSVGRMPIVRAIDGSTDCNAVLPAATTSNPANSTAKSRRGIALMAPGVAEWRGLCQPCGFRAAAPWPPGDAAIFPSHAACARPRRMVHSVSAALDRGV